MIGFAIVLAFIDVVVFSQLSIWGMYPVALAALIYVFREERHKEVVIASAAIYGFVLSIFMEPVDGLLTLTAAVTASLLAVGVVAFLGKSRMRIRVRGYDAALVAVVFTIPYWLIRMAEVVSSMDIGRVALFMIWSVVVNLGLMVLGGQLIRRII